MNRTFRVPPALAAFVLLTSLSIWLGACRKEDDALPIGQAAGPPGVSEGTIPSGGRQRTYRLYVPASLDPARPAPLVVALHGGLGTPAQFAASSRFDAAAEAHAFIVVYPAGVGRTWNGGACCGQAARQDVDDVAFIAALIDHLSGRYRIDPNRVFVTGHSNGGIMAFRLACELADRVAAVAPVAASLEVDSCSPSRPVAVLAIHGDADLNHPIEGGVGPNSIAGVPFNSLAASMESLRRANGCSDRPDVRREGAITTTTWRNCREGGHTEQKVIAGASHAWPGGDPRSAGPGGTPSTVLDATTAIWAFFAAHGR